MDDKRLQVIDRVHMDFAQRYVGHEDHWLMIQTLYTAAGRRAFIDRLPALEGVRILDIGSGFGAFAFDLAASAGAAITAIDTDRSTLGLALEMQARIEREGGFHPSATLRQEYANVYQLPYADASYDLVLARLVFQHLQDPLGAMREIQRVLCPGGTFIAVDIDDQMVITYPEVSQAFATLQRAFAELQRSKGGDRYVGRKLATYMSHAGFRDIAIDIRPQAAYARVEQGDVSLQFSVLRFARARDEVVRQSIMSAQDYDRYLEQLSSEWGLSQFASNAQFYVEGKKA